MRFSVETPIPTDDEDTDDTPVALCTSLSSSRTSSKNAANFSSKKAFSKKVVGTCKTIEKSYFRLTTFPKAEKIRPLHILQKSLEYVKTKYIVTEDFEWANDQLKAVRQDLTVQGIRSPFCLEVYETHARILLENGDLGEFNQCQSMIRTLTEYSCEKDNIGCYDYYENSSTDDKEMLQQSEEHKDEFKAYQLIYSMVQNSWTDLNTALTDTGLDGHSCQHALIVVKAVIQSDFHTFFKLYESAPNLSAYLMDFLVKRVRSDAYERIVSSYRPTMGVEHFREALSFENLEETRQFLKKSKAVFVEDTESEFWVDCKASSDELR